MDVKTVELSVAAETEETLAIFMQGMTQGISSVQKYLQEEVERGNLSTEVVNYLRNLIEILENSEVIVEEKTDEGDDQS